MIIEAQHCKGLSVLNNEGRSLGKIDRLVVNATGLRLAGAVVIASKLYPTFHGLFFDDVIQIDRAGWLVKSAPPKTNIKELDKIALRSGAIIGVKAVTESGDGLGHVSDFFFEAETGEIARFVIRHFLKERIIPRQFVVSVTPQAVVFQDEVNKPTFETAVAAEPAS